MLPVCDRATTYLFQIDGENPSVTRFFSIYPITKVIYEFCPALNS